MIVQVPPGQQQKTYEGLEVSVIRLDEGHLLLMAPTPTEMQRHIAHSVDEIVELFRSYVNRLMAQQKPGASSGGQTAADWEKKFEQDKKSKENN